jgi:hypothetical protein
MNYLPNAPLDREPVIRYLMEIANNNEDIYFMICDYLEAVLDATHKKDTMPKEVGNFRKSSRAY